MGVFEWGAVAALVAVGGIVWRLAWRLSSNTERITAAETLATAASARTVELTRALAEHKEHVAAEYVSRGALKEITDAINRLGDRLDNLFIHMMPKP
ncbi:MAG: hypothetical protein WBB98_04520 [Xanthobacteraceae bacterium]|jgi:hypothetical protein